MLYASVGFGGGSSYLAILVLTSMNFQEVRATALICNIVVVSNAVFTHLKKKHYSLKETIPLVITSVPFAFIGGYLKISKEIFYPMLAICLLTSAILMIIRIKKHSQLNQSVSTFKHLGYGGAIGLLSGAVGIGGGIFLAPLLHLTRWNTPLRIAAISSIFIWVNSISGLIGQCLNPELHLNLGTTAVLSISVLLGGAIGTYAGVNLANAKTLKLGTAFLVAYVAIRILIEHSFNFLN